MNNQKLASEQLIHQLIQQELSKYRTATVKDLEKNNVKTNYTHMFVGLGIMCIIGSITVFTIQNLAEKKQITNCINENQDINSKYSNYIEHNKPIERKFYKIEPPTSPFTHDMPKPPVTSVKNAKIALADKERINKMVKHDEIAQIVAENNIRNVIKGQ